MQSIIKQSTTTLAVRVNKSKDCASLSYTFLHTEEHTLQVKEYTCSEAELLELSVHLHAEIHLQLNLQIQSCCISIWDAICVRVECVKAELECFASITFEALCLAFRCIKLKIIHGAEHCKQHIECLLEETKEAACHVLVEVAYAFHCLKLKLFAVIAKVKLAIYWSSCKLREICNSLKVELNIKYHDLKIAIKQLKCYLRGVLHCAFDKVKAGFAWLKSILCSIKIRMHHCKDHAMSHIHRKCLEVLLPCMSAEVIGRISICHTEAQAICRPIMWSNLTIHSSLWTTSKKFSKDCSLAIAEIHSWKEIHEHIKTVTVSCKGVENKTETNFVATQFLQQIAQPSCGIRPSLVQFKEVSIRSEWTASIRQMETVKRVQVKKCDVEDQPLCDSKAYTSFTIDIEELESLTVQPLLYKQLKTLVVVIKIGERTRFQFAENRFVEIKNRRVLKLKREELWQESELQVQVERTHARVLQMQNVQALQLTKIKYEFTERTTKKVIRVTCPVNHGC